MKYVYVLESKNDGVEFIFKEENKARRYRNNENLRVLSEKNGTNDDELEGDLLTLRAFKLIGGK